MGVRKSILGILFALAFSGCEAVPKIAEVIMDPDVPVGEAEEQPSEVSLHIYAAAEVNPDFESGTPSPVIVQVYALSSDHRFMTYDYFSIVEFPQETLDITLREVLDEGQLQPDSYQILGPYELPARTRKIGVVAQYYDIDTAVWRDSISVSDIGADDRLLVLLLEEEVRIIKEAE